VTGITVMPEPAGVESSCQYFVIRIDEREFGASRDMVFERLKAHNVFARKYFFPLCTDYACYSDLPSAAPGRLPVASAIVNQVLCLPLYGTLELSIVEEICDLVVGIQVEA
jgi:dTDP-4-amino-4,6-dideoxygalactose transaminase